MSEANGGDLSGDGSEEEAFSGKGVTHLEEKMEVTIGVGDGNRSPGIWENRAEGVVGT